MQTAIPNADELVKLIRKAAHDARTPLTSISGFAELIAEDASVSAPARDNALTVIEEASRLSELLESFFKEMREKLEADGR